MNTILLIDDDQDILESVSTILESKGYQTVKAANGTEGLGYEEIYCWSCVHNHSDWGCPCWDSHQLWNYEECNKKDSILHKMIPRGKQGNEECIFFRKKAR